MGEVLDWLIEAGADYVLIDCPPVLPVTDPAVLARHVDAAIMVCVPGQTREADLAEACERLRRVGGDIIGVVLNGLPAGPRYGHTYAGYHGGQNTSPMSVPSQRAARDLRDHPTSNGQQTAGTPDTSESELAGRRAE
jgi:Mrp family chromosome partitioning ATPase